MEQLDYRDFEVQIDQDVGMGYRVQVLHSPRGQARSTMRLSFDPSTLDQRLAELEDAILGYTEGDSASVVKSFGVQLFDALFQGEVRSAYDSSRDATDENGEGLRIKLRINAPELDIIPWEFLYDPRQGDYLVLSRRTPIVRYPELPLPDQELAVAPPLRILGMVASPADAEPLDVAGEKTRLENAVHELQDKGVIELTWVEGQTSRDLQTTLQRGPWHIFHFIGHAISENDSGEGALLLADEAGRSLPLSATHLARLLADQHTLRLALLNACEGARGYGQGLFSSTASVLARRGVPAVLAMQYAISDRAAIEFTTSFYQALAANLPIDAAVSEGREAITLNMPESMEWGTPVLYLRAPDGLIWEIETEPKRQSLLRLPLPVLLTPLLLLVVLGILVYPRLQPLWYPAPMTGQFRVAVAEFGQVDSRGKVRRTETGRVLSKWLFEGLHNEYQQNADAGLTDKIEIWHDSRKDTEQNLKFGVMTGDTAQERRTAAANLADRIKAHMVIYGNLIPAGESQKLELEFYLSPLVNDEIASIIGPHRLGKPIALPSPFDLDGPEVNIFVDEKLRVRTDALFWLTIGLTQQVLGRSQRALETFQRAEGELADWSEHDGKEMLYFFIGREELFLGQVDDAEASFRRVLDIAPDYARAQVALGSIYQERAARIEPTERFKEPKYVEQALEGHLKGLELALATDEPLIEAVARIALAKTYRLLGETHHHLDEVEQASGFYEQTIAEVDRSMPLLENTKQHRLIAQAYETQGIAYLLQGLILQFQEKRAESQAHLELAQNAYQQCIQQSDKALVDAILSEDIALRCQRLQGETQKYLATLEGGNS
jgi:tetratricopeptide (TPR) repeat protein